MDIGDSYLDDFFNSAKCALQEENKILERYISNCEKEKKLYKKMSHGIWILNEPNMVYLVFRELLKNKFDYEVEWEVSYPEKKEKKADLSIKKRGIEKPIAYIEFKIGDFWESKGKEKLAKDIKKDSKKMEEYAKDARRFIFAIWLEKRDGLEDLNWAKNLRLQLNRLNYKCSFPTKVYKDKQLRELKIVLALLEAT